MSAEPGDLRDTMSFLGRIEKDAHLAQRAEKAKIVILAILIILTSSYMTWIHVSLARLPPKELVGQAGAWVEGKLPDFSGHLKRRAIEEAPGLMNRGRKLLLQAPSLLRQLFEENLHEGTTQLIRLMEDELNRTLATALEEQSAQIARQVPTQSSQGEKLELLFQKSIRTFGQGIRQYLAGHGHDFAQAIQGLTTRLDYLRTHAGLNEKEKLQKEIIELWVVLVQKFHRLDMKNPLPLGENQEKEEGGEDGKGQAEMGGIPPVPRDQAARPKEAPPEG
jgi:hypothetical protein